MEANAAAKLRARSWRDDGVSATQGEWSCEKSRKTPAVASHALPNQVFWEAALCAERYNQLISMARPERFELPAPRFVV
jgi:hypothetical protein